MLDSNLKQRFVLKSTLQQTSTHHYVCIVEDLRDLHRLLPNSALSYVQKIKVLIYFAGQKTGRAFSQCHSVQPSICPEKCEITLKSSLYLFREYNPSSQKRIIDLAHCFWKEGNAARRKCPVTSILPFAKHSGPRGPHEAQISVVKHEFHCGIISGFEEQQDTRQKVLSQKKCTLQLWNFSPDSKGKSNYGA